MQHTVVRMKDDSVREVQRVEAVIDHAGYVGAFGGFPQCTNLIVAEHRALS
jgi:hypothetical protein